MLKKLSVGIALFTMMAVMSVALAVPGAFARGGNIEPGGVSGHWRGPAIVGHIETRLIWNDLDGEYLVDGILYGVCAGKEVSIEFLIPSADAGFNTRAEFEAATGRSLANIPLGVTAPDECGGGSGLALASVIGRNVYVEVLDPEDAGIENASLCTDPEDPVDYGDTCAFLEADVTVNMLQP